MRLKFDPNIVKKFDFSNNKTLNHSLNKAEKLLNIKQRIGENWFFDVIENDNIEGEDFFEIDFNFSASNISIINDTGSILIFSWDGKSVDGILKTKEDFHVNQLERNKIFIKINGECRIWAF